MPLKHFLSFNDCSKKELLDILFTAKAVKEKPKKYQDIMRGKVLGFLFNKPSTRTRVSFEAGMYQMGGNAVFLTEKEIQIGRGESIKDTAKVLSRYLDAIVIRTFEHQILLDFSANSDIPVINGLSDLLHPCQILADILTIVEKKKKIENLKVVYIGDGANNIANSWIEAARIFDFNLTIATPDNYQPAPEILNSAKGRNITITKDILSAAKNADVLYTDVWVSMGQEAEKSEKIKIFSGYQINSEILKTAKSDAIVMHCLPAHCGEEITEDVLYCPQSVVFDQAENRLHAQKALLLKLLS